MPDDRRSRWQEVEALLDAALERPPGQRLAWLDAQPAAPAVIDEVRSLLEAESGSEAFFDLEDDAPPLLAPGQTVGAWAVVRLLGRGGMGEVYEVARADGRYQQRAALKLLAHLDSAEDRRRFNDERRWLARLEHPHIARLLDGGEWQNRPYAVMEFVEGQVITEALREAPVARVVTVFLDVCAAVSHAHRHFVVHRDIKPGNVLVTPDGQVKLLDFGIAKSLARPGEPTEVTRVLRLSPDYCAPEQLEGGPVTAATDVYALGALLYELLAGQRPFQLAGLTLTRVLSRLNHGAPLPPSQVAPQARQRAIRGDLDAIVLKALRPEPAARYGTVEALAEDLRAWRESRPVSARQGSTGYVLRRLLRRQRRWFLLAGAVFLSLSLGLVGMAWQARQAAIERDIAQAEVRRSEAVRQYLMLMFENAGRADGGQGVSAREVLDRAVLQLKQAFHRDPANLTVVLHALAELYIFLNHDLGAEPLLEALLELAEYSDPDTLARAHHDLALVLSRRNAIEEAAQHLERAQGFWNAHPARYAELLLESRLVEARIRRARGDGAGAVSLLEAALAERLRRGEVQHRQTAVLRNNLGVQLAYAGRLEEAVHQYRQADALWQALALSESEDALNTLNNWASLESQRGDPAAALPLFERALALRRQLYGPSGATAALHNNLAKSLLLLGRAAEARPLLVDGLDQALTHVGPGSLLVVAILSGLADADVALGELDQAAVWLAMLAEQMPQHFPDDHPARLMAAVSGARLLWATGERDDAFRQLSAAGERLAASGQSGGALQQQVQRQLNQWSAEMAR